jgi:hypothetical protein
MYERIRKLYKKGCRYSDADMKLIDKANKMIATAKPKTPQAIRDLGEMEGYLYFLLEKKPTETEKEEAAEFIKIFNSKSRKKWFKGCQRIVFLPTSIHCGAKTTKKLAKKRKGYITFCIK